MMLAKDLVTLLLGENEERGVKWVVGVSDWPESPRKTFDIFPVREGETDEEALQRAKDQYSQDLEVYIVNKPVRGRS
jgi:hypothetical protein